MMSRWMNSRRTSIWGAPVLGVLLLGANFAAAQTPSPALLVLEKSDNSLAIVDPVNLQVVARVPAGPDPHEIVASADGKLAYISNYGAGSPANWRLWSASRQHWSAGYSASRWRSAPRDGPAARRPAENMARNQRRGRPRSGRL